LNIHGIVNFEYINFLIWKHILKPHKMNMFFDFLMDNEKWKWNRKLKIEKGKHFFITQHTLITSRTSIICNIIWTKNKAHLQGVPLLLGLGPEWLGISFGTKAHLCWKNNVPFAWYLHNNVVGFHARCLQASHWEFLIWSTNIFNYRFKSAKQKRKRKRKKSTMQWQFVMAWIWSFSGTLTEKEKERTLCADLIIDGPFLC